ncbi:MAG: acetylornithine/N-succinyldiaminopimelate aminotransferase [Verrucomicrobiales bacterium]|jgi:acetylornithine/N-succinyldiaminopimelate aminotransferase
MNTTTEPALTTPELFENYVAPTYGRFRVAPVRGQGCWLWDEAGKKYLDFGAGIAVCSLGHAHPRMAGAIHAQANALVHCSNLYQLPAQGRLARLLVDEVIKIPGKIFFCNSGAEANELLYKLGRRYGTLTPKADGDPRLEIITFSKSFHGRTLAGIAATGQEKVKNGFGPLMEGFRHLPYNDVEALRAAINENTVAILLEAVQGEGGINVATPEFLKAIAELCREHDMLFLLDEIQCGVGRTGNLRGWETALGEHAEAAEVVPDAVSWAKGIGGGFPFGAVWMRNRAIPNASDAPLCDMLGPGSHGTTYGGSPLGCAAVTAVIEEILEKNLPAHVEAMGNYLRKKLAEAELPFIQHIRGLGLMVGMVVDTDSVSALKACQDAGTPPAIFLVDALNKAKLLTIPAGPDVVRLLPPLNVTEAEIDTAVFMLKTTFEKLVAAP